MPQPALDLNVVEEGSGRPVTCWLLAGDTEKTVQLDVHAAGPVELNVESARAARDWLTEWLGEETGMGATLFESTLPGEQAELSDPAEKQLGAFVRDSDTSRQAAIANWPRQGTQRMRIIDELGKTGTLGATRQQLAEWLRLSENTIRPRIVELMEGGWVEVRMERGEPVTRPTRDNQAAEVLILTHEAVQRRRQEIEAARA